MILSHQLSYPKSRDAIGSKNLLKDVLRGRYFNSNLNCLFATLTRPVTRYKTQQTSKHKQSLNVCSELPTNYNSLSTTYFYAVLNQFLYHKLGIMTFLLKLRQGVTNFKKFDHLVTKDFFNVANLFSSNENIKKQFLRWWIF